MDKKQVFISYKSEEFDEANWVRTVLETNGISCWMAPMCITGGSSYATEIPQAIRNCTVFVLILSEQSQSSKWVSREVDRAINENKIIMPFMLENCSLKDDFNFYLTNVQRYAAYESKMAAVEKMVREIKAILGIKDEPIQEESKKEESKKEEPKLEESKVEEPKKEEPKKEGAKKEGPKKAESKPAKKKKNLLPIVGIVVAVILAIVVGTTLISESNKLTIAGVEVNKDDSSITIENATITAEDVEKLISMEELTSLYIEGCSIEPALMKELSKLNLYVLRMNNCNLSNEHLSNIDFSKWEDLWRLELQGNPDITELTGLEHVADSLEELYIGGCSVTSLEVLSGSSNITDLDVSGNQLTSLKGIENNIGLDYLHAQNNQLTTLEGLENTSVLRDVNLRNNQISDISILAKSAQKLQYLYIDNNPIGKLGAISNCLELKNLDADNCGLTSLSSLSEHEKLTYLSVADNSLISLSGIEKNQNLSYLDASNNNFISTTGIEELTFMDSNGYQGTVDLSNSALLGLQLSDELNVSSLAIYGNDISTLEAIESCKIYKLYLEYQSTIDFAKLAEAKIDYFYIINCPLDQQMTIEEMLGTYTVAFVTAEEADELQADSVPSAMKDE